MLNIKKILISCGGTGGHIYPAISIANELKNELKIKKIKSKFIFIGGINNMEMSIISKSGYNIKGIYAVKSPKRIFTKKTLFLPFKIIYSVLKCLRIIKKFKPDICIGTGGYVSCIPLLISFFKKIPLVIHEQNIIPGYVNKNIGNKLAEKIFVSYKETKKFFPIKKTIFTGNPIRQNLINCKNKVFKNYKIFGLNPKKFTILSLGGSQGSRSINDFWLKNIKIIIKNKIQIIWQTGKKNYKNIKLSKCLKNFKNLCIKKYISNIGDAYKISDIVISRAGAMSISEIAFFEKPLILIPLPNSSKNHQEINAINLVKKKAAIMIKDNKIQNKLFNTIIKTMKNKNTMNLLSENIKKIQKINSSKIIAKEIIKINQ